MLLEDLGELAGLAQPLDLGVQRLADASIPLRRGKFVTAGRTDASIASFGSISPIVSPASGLCSMRWLASATAVRPASGDAVFR